MTSDPKPPARAARDWVAVILAVGFTIAINVVTFATMIVAINDRPLSENATQLLTAAFGGVIGVLGSYLGFRAGERHVQKQLGHDPEEQEDQS